MHPEPPSAGKWKKKNDKNTQLEALDLEIRIGKSDESK